MVREVCICPIRTGVGEPGMGDAQEAGGKVASAPTKVRFIRLQTNFVKKSRVILLSNLVRFMNLDLEVVVSYYNNNNTPNDVHISEDFS